MQTALATTIRSANSEDLNAIIRIQRGAPEASQWSSDWYRQTLLESASRYSVLVAVHLDEVVGFAVTLDTVGEQEILNLAVAQESRRSGVGTLLVSAVGRRTAAVHLEGTRAQRARRAFLQAPGIQSRGSAYRLLLQPTGQRLSHDIEPMTPE